MTDITQVLPTISALDAEQKIRNSKGKVFRVLFRKKDGSLRWLTGRVGVTEGVTGEGMNYNPRDHFLIPVYEFVSDRDPVTGKFFSRGGQWRMVSLERMERLRIGGTLYAVDPKGLH